ncbi:MAG: PTS sugar transporter subunit IIB [Olsenella sp.]|jgi:PTS system cellobiose-specific IIB component|nr:PTS sugar transporter subunit IIB [Olsenella sp.]MCI1792422.1 PTS sugar transporter subunit IIB [Olsenella sp.]MCI1879779.1 PTS sugar transporter subunit IIB [Olsenella sp.]MCI2156179.1 PTS sugar transporter subunit IIB [Olsenella sp.]
MKEYKILLVCSGGMSTSVLMNKMEKYAQEKGISLKVDACGTGNYGDEAKDYDIILLGPQIAYRKAQIAGTVNIPVVPIAPQDYAFGNVENILKGVDKVLG